MARPVHDRSVTKYLRRKKKERKKGRKKERKKKVERKEGSSGHVVQMWHMLSCGADGSTRRGGHVVQMWHMFLCGAGGGTQVVLMSVVQMLHRGRMIIKQCLY